MSKAAYKQHRLMSLGITLSLLLLVSACSATHPSRRLSIDENRQALVDIINHSSNSFGPRPAIPGPDTLHGLTDAQRREFLDYIEDPLRNHIPRHQRVYDYLKSLTDHFDYYEQTLPANVALARQSGNCMSLAVLTTALAQAAGIEIGYRLMEDLPVYEYQGDTVVKGIHLSTILYKSGWTPPSSDVLYVRRPGLQVDYFPSARTKQIANVGDTDYLAMYYQNVAVEELERGNLDNAYWFALEALQYDPVYAAAISTLAVVHRRHGDATQAERLYRYGLARTGDNLGLLRNYHALLVAEGRDSDARVLSLELDNKDDASPFRWLILARDAEQEGNYDSAIRFYHKALDLAPYMHEVQLGLALAHYRSGRLRDAREILRDAIVTVPAEATKRLYQAKFELLEQELLN